MSIAKVKLWGKTIGAVAWDDKQELATFEYSPQFIQSHIEISPLTMPLSNQIYAFPALNKKTFHGLPGLLSDSLPDKFGNALINAWLAKEGRSPKSFNAVERLCYIGKRGMGALEFEPAKGPGNVSSKNIDLNALVELASDILSQRQELKGTLNISEQKKTMQDILKVGTSAGGARAKALIAWNSETNEIRSGQIKNDPDFSYWILKFDGVSNNRDKELNDPKGFGSIEYAYHKMAVACGIEMTECRLMKENDRAHFMTRRFDRLDSGQKVHMQSLGALAHYDFNQAGAHSYEQAIMVIRQLGLGMDAIEEQFRRMAFNIMARNQDDHVKNIAFLMDQNGEWKLSPAFDVAYSYNPDGMWTGQHQMSVNGKRDHFTKQDFIDFAKNTSMQKNRALAIVEQTQSVVSKWKHFAEEAGLSFEIIQQIGKTHRKDILK